MRKIVGIIILMALAVPGLAQAAPPSQNEGGGQAYTVQAEDSLSRLAAKFYQDFEAWPAIQLATNARAAQDSRFTVIKNPNIIEAGQLVWIPDPAEAARLLAGYLPDQPELQPTTGELLAEFESFIENSRQHFEIPGAAVVVVQGQQVILAQGFGVRELGRAEPVTPETIFAVGSTTKAMTSMLLATLVDEGKLDWDQPVVELWPDFKLAEPAVTPKIRLRHLLNMSSGVPRADLIWSGADLTAEQLMGSVADLPLVTPPGQWYHYNNQMFATGGYIGTLAAGGQHGHLGQAYLDLLQARIFAPIGMSSATPAIEVAQAQPNHATPHDFTLFGEVIPTHYHADPGIAPAGAVNAHALDMARFLMTCLGQGVTPDGTRIVSAETLAETWQPQVKVTKNLSYGMGWFIEAYKGIRMIWHDGDVLGFKALIAFIPEANLGLVVLTNRTISTGFSYSLRYHLLELLYGLDFEEEVKYEAQWTAFNEALTKLRAPLKPLVDPGQVEPYLGNYSGNWRVELRAGNTLWAVRGPYEWRLLPAAEEGAFLVNNGFGIAVPLQFSQADNGETTMTFRLTSGEVGTYQRLD